MAQKTKRLPSYSSRARAKRRADALCGAFCIVTAIVLAGTMLVGPIAMADRMDTPHCHVWFGTNSIYSQLCRH